MPCARQGSRDRRADTARTEHDDVFDAPLVGRQPVAPLSRGLGRADHDDSVARLDDSFAPRDDRRVPTDDRDDTGVGRQRGLAEGDPDEPAGVAVVDLELDDLNLTVGEDVRLPRGRHADRLGDRVRGLELGGHREVDVEATLLPELDVLHVGGANDRRRLGRIRPREDAGDEVRLVARGAGDEETGFQCAGVCERPPARAVCLDRADVVAVGERRQPRGLHVDHGDVVLVVERRHDRRANLPRPDDEDLHAAGRVLRSAPTPRDVRSATLMRCAGVSSSAERFWRSWCRSSSQLPPQTGQTTPPLKLVKVASKAEHAVVLADRPR